MSNPSSSSEKPVWRLWYRLHLSSWLVFLAALCAGVLLVVPGEEAIEFNRQNVDFVRLLSPRVEHGWAQQLDPTAPMLQGMTTNDMNRLGPGGIPVSAVVARPALQEENLGANGDYVLAPQNLPALTTAIENAMNIAAPGSLVSHTGNATLKKVGAFTAFMNNPLPVTYTITFTDDNGDYQIHGTGFGTISKDEVFPNQYAFVLANWWSGAPKTGDSFTYSVNPSSNVVAMPVLFRTREGDAVAVTTNFVNSLVDGHSVIAGMGFGPAVQWAGSAPSDILQSYAYWAFASAGFSKTNEVFVDARAYNNRAGLVHCGTNVIREIPAKKWWQM